jgi:hypothetical protein
LSPPRRTRRILAETIVAAGTLKAIPLTHRLFGEYDLEISDESGTTFDMNNAQIYVKNAAITNGTLRIQRGTGGAVYLYSLNAQTATQNLETHVGAYETVFVSNLVLRSNFTTHSGATTSRGYKVYGTFKTETAMFPFVLFMDGSTFDLKSRSRGRSARRHDVCVP